MTRASITTEMNCYYQMFIRKYDEVLKEYHLAYEGIQRSITNEPYSTEIGSEINFTLNRIVSSELDIQDHHKNEYNLLSKSIENKIDFQIHLFNEPQTHKIP